MQQAADILADVPSLQAVFLFGSHARGTADAWSDIDVLGVPMDGQAKLRPLRDDLRERLGGLPVQLRLSRAERLEAHFDAGSTFACHLATEAQPVLDRFGLLRRLRQGFAPKRAGLSRDLDRLRRGLRPYHQLTAFNGHYELLYADCYAMARSAAMTLMVAAGAPTFDRRVLFERTADAYPALAPAAGRIAQLEAAYFATRRSQGGAPIPAGGHDDDAASEAVAACRSILWTAV